MKLLNKTRQKLYNTARILGDINAISTGRPDKILKRILRKKSGRRFGKIIKFTFK